MKKVFALVLALALALSMAVMASAAVADDAKKVLEELAATVGADQLKAAFEEVWADVSKGLDLPKGKELNAADLKEDTGATVADGLVAKLGLEGTDIATKIQDAMSNDFVSFLAGMYTGPVTTKPPTGDSTGTVIAISAAVALSAAAAAAFVFLKKKED